jgi:hypothetical protein
VVAVRPSRPAHTPRIELQETLLLALARLRGKSLVVDVDVDGNNRGGGGQRKIAHLVQLSQALVGAPRALQPSSVLLDLLLLVWGGRRTELTAGNLNQRLCRQLRTK